VFTGIIQAVGEVTRVSDREGIREIRISTPPDFLEGVELGDSIAVDGACLTPVSVEVDAFTVEAVATTLEKTVAGRYGVGTRVNLEKALALGDRLDGHMVQGHVDGLGKLVAVRDRGETRIMEVRLPREIHGATILHGSIALNGVSLTVSGMEDPGRIEVAIIPHTWSHTNFPDLAPGDAINVEGDLIGKYVGKLLGRMFPAGRGRDDAGTQDTGKRPEAGS
jgi:riboflavin synthase